jgi:signal transduction histidine kinase
LVGLTSGTDSYTGTDIPWIGMLILLPGVLGIAFGSRTRSLRLAEARAQQLELERREMKRLVGVLREDDEEIGLAPQPGLADVERLVEQVRGAGLRVELRVEGERRPVPIGVDLSAYRVVQEALTNALKHARNASAVVTTGGPRWSVHASSVQTSC